MKIILCLLFLFGGFSFGHCDIDARLKRLEKLVNEHIMDQVVFKEKLNVLEESVSDLSEALLNVADPEQRSETEEQKNSYDLKHSPASLEKRVSKRVSAGDVAFHAYLSSSRQYSNHEIIIFDRYTVNERSGYTSVDGIFNTPVSGVYVFTWTITVPSQGQRIVTELIARGSVIGVLSSDSDKGDVSVSGVHPATAFVVAHVSAGYNVFVRVRSVASGNGNVLSDDFNVRSSFSAWRLF